jgi:hypothetical protein
LQKWWARHDAEHTTKKVAPRAPATFQRYEGFSSGLTLLRLVGCTLCGLPPFTTFVDDGSVTGHGSGSLRACLVASSAAGQLCHDVHAVIEALGRAVTPEIKAAYYTKRLEETAADADHRLGAAERAARDEGRGQGGCFGAGGGGADGGGGGGGGDGDDGDGDGRGDGGGPATIAARVRALAPAFARLAETHDPHAVREAWLCDVLCVMCSSSSSSSILFDFVLRFLAVLGGHAG